MIYKRLNNIIKKINIIALVVNLNKKRKITMAQKVDIINMIILV